MTDPEREVLRFAAAHRLVTAEQAAALPALAGTDPVATLDGLVAAGLLARYRLVGAELTMHAITPDGLAQIESDLPLPELEATGLRHGLAAGWVWLRAGDGRFAGAEVLSEREQVARDIRLTDETTRSGGPRSCGLRVPGFATPHATGLHYADVLLTYPDAWIAVHVQPVMPSQVWLAGLLRAYGADERYQRVVFLVEHELVAQKIEVVARSVGVASLVSVQWMEWPDPVA